MLRHPSTLLMGIPRSHGSSRPVLFLRPPGRLSANGRPRSPILPNATGCSLWSNPLVSVHYNLRCSSRAAPVGPPFERRPSKGRLRRRHDSVSSQNSTTPSRLSSSGATCADPSNMTFEVLYAASTVLRGPPLAHQTQRL